MSAAFISQMEAELDAFLASIEIGDRDDLEDPYACQCLQVDEDLFDNRYCLAHGGSR